MRQAPPTVSEDKRGLPAPGLAVRLLAALTAASVERMLVFRQGAFQGVTPREAYLVKCGADTTTQVDVDRGIVNVLVGFAPLRPGELVILQLQLAAGPVQAGL